MTREASCCFTGPRPARLPSSGLPDSPAMRGLVTALGNAVREAFDDGYRWFYCGMALGFDLLAAEAVLRLRRQEPVFLVAALPCPRPLEGSSGSWAAAAAPLLRQADLTVYVDERWSPGCEHRRNRYMAEHSSRLIGWYDGLSGGTAHCWQYAASLGLELRNLYPNEI